MEAARADTIGSFAHISTANDAIFLTVGFISTKSIGCKWVSHVGADTGIVSVVAADAVSDSIFGTASARIGASGPVFPPTPPGALFHEVVAIACANIGVGEHVGSLLICGVHFYTTTFARVDWLVVSVETLSGFGSDGSLTASGSTS